MSVSSSCSECGFVTSQHSLFTHMTRPGGLCVLRVSPHPRVCFLLPQIFFSRGAERHWDLLRQVLFPSPRKAVRWLLPEQFSQGVYKKCRDQATWRHMRAEGHTSCTSHGGGGGNSVVFTGKSDTRSRGLINGTTFTGTSCPAFWHMQIFCVVAEIQEIHSFFFSWGSW